MRDASFHPTEYGCEIVRDRHHEVVYRGRIAEHDVRIGTVRDLVEPGERGCLGVHRRSDIVRHVCVVSGLTERMIE
jgi:hypothetical protein